MKQTPPCPYCGERQHYDDATLIPVPAFDYRERRGSFVRVRTMEDESHCRRCNARIVWSVHVETWTGRGVDRSRAGEYECGQIGCHHDGYSEEDEA